jgi:hypothetical protein
MHARLTRLARLMTATILALAALAAVAGSANAQDPTCGNKLCLQTTHSPDSDLPADDFVSQNSVVTYRVEVTNPGTATATKVTLRFELDRNNPNPAMRRLTAVTPLPAGCTEPAPAPAPNVITCSVGSVKPTGDTPIVFLFNVRTPATAALTSSVASITADARASDKGNNPNDPTVEDFEDVPEPVEVRLVDGRSVSAVPNGVTAALDTDADGSGANGIDTRTAKFTLFPVGFSTTANIKDSVGDTFVCPQGLKCPGGGWTEAVIPGPLNDPFAPFVPPSRMDIELVYDVTTLGQGFNLNQYALLHDLDYDASTTDYEQITQLCGSNPVPPCLRQKPMLLPNGDLLVKALVQGNWRYR